MNRQAQRDISRKLKVCNHVIGLSSIYHCTSEALRNPSSPIEDRLSDFSPKRLVAGPMLSFNIAGKGLLLPVPGYTRTPRWNERLIALSECK